MRAVSAPQPQILQAGLFMALSHFPCLLVMHFAFFSVLLLAGQGRSCHFFPLTPCNVIAALSLSIAVGGSVGTVDATQFLNVTDAYLLTDVRHTTQPSSHLLTVYISARPNAPTQTLRSPYVPLSCSLPYLISPRPAQQMIPVSAHPTQ